MDNLDNYALKNNPIESFSDWYDQATKCEQNAEAMSLSTIGPDGRPNARTVLFKGIKEGGLVFYTNYKSPKAQDLTARPEACVVFYWHISGRQVRVNGHVKRLSRDESVKYFQSRDKESQIASFISTQSSPIADKQELLNRFESAKKEFADKPVPTPEHWGGFVIEPYEIEFFVYGNFRLNDRFLFKKDSASSEWKYTRVQP